LSSPADPENPRSDVTASPHDYEHRVDTRNLAQRYHTCSFSTPAG
jgi:hypothetical protein